MAVFHPPLTNHAPSIPSLGKLPVTLVLLGTLVLSGLAAAASAAPESQSIPNRVFAEVTELLRSPPGREGHNEKLQRYTKALRTARSYAAEYADSPDLYKLHNVMLVALQARMNLEVDAKTYQQLLKIAEKVVESDAPRRAKLEADLVLVREQFRVEKPNQHQRRMAIFDFVGRYQGSGVGEKALIYGGQLAASGGDQELVHVLRTELWKRPGFWDRPGVTGFLRRNSGFNLSGRSFSTRLTRLDGTDLRLPDDLLGKHVLMLFWSVDDPNSTNKIDQLEALHEAHADRFEIVTISLDESKQDVLRYVKANGLDWMHTFSGRGLRDPFAWTYGITGTPSVLHADPLGRGRHIKGMQGWYTNKRSSTAIKDYGRPIDRVIGGIRDFENLHDISHHYLTGEFLVHMDLGLFSEVEREADHPLMQEIDTLHQTVQAIRNSPADERKVALARQVVERVVELEQAHPDAGGLVSVRNAGLVAARVLSLKTGETEHAQVAQRLAEAIDQTLEDEDKAQAVGLLADYVLTQGRLVGQPVHAEAVNREINAFADRYADGPAEAAASILASLIAVQVGDDGMIRDSAQTLEQSHPEAPQARSFLRYMHRRPVDRGTRFTADLTRLDGSTLSLPDDLRGKPVVLWFWDADSIRAHRELPTPKGRWRAPPYAGLSPSDHEDLVIVGVNLDESLEAAQPMIEGELKNWIHTRPPKQWRDKLVERLDIHSLPSCWIIDRDGYLVADDMVSARLRSPVLAAAMHQPPPHSIRERMVNQWRVLGPFHQRENERHTETGFASAAPCLQTTAARKAWFELQGWRRWPFSHVERQFDARFSKGSFPPARAETEIDFDATYDDGDGNQIGWRSAESDRAGFVNLDSLYPTRPAPAIAYAVTYVHSETGGTYPAALLSTYDITLRVNGDEAIRLMTKVRIGENKYKPVCWAGQRINRGWNGGAMPRQDQQLLRKDRTQIRLRKGWNEVFIKTVDARGLWRFQLRIGDPDRTLRYARRPGNGPDAYGASLPKWAPPADDDPRDRLLEKVDTSEAVRITAVAGALGRLGNELAVTPEEAASLDGPALMQIMHAMDLWEPHDPVSERFKDAGPIQRILRVIDPAKSLDAVIEVLEQKKAAYQNPDTHHHQRRGLRHQLRAIIRAVGVIGTEPAVEKLVELFEQQKQRRAQGEGDRHILQSLVAAAEQARHAALLPYLRPLLDSEHKRLRGDAISAMLAIDAAHERYAEQLIKAIKAQGWRRFTTHRYLAKVGDPKARKTLENIARNFFGNGGMPEDIFAIRMVHHLESFQHPDVVDEIARFLMHKHMHVRIKTLQALGRLGFKQATPALLEAFEKPANRELRHHIVAALGRCGDPRAEPLLNQVLTSDDYGLRILAAEGLGAGAGSRASAAGLIDALADPHWLVRAFAAEALGGLGAETAGEPLIKAMDDDHTDVRLAAAEALGKLQVESAVDTLTGHLGDWRVGPHAATALDRLGWAPGGKPSLRVRYLVAKRRFADLKNDWQTAERVLTADLESGGNAGVNAAFAFIALGQDAGIPRLVNYLKTSNEPAVAAAMLNCGHDQLEDAARQWAASNRFAIRAARIASPVRWNVSPR